MRKWFLQLSNWVSDTLHNPTRVLFICGIAIALSLVFDGTLIQIWRLNRNIQSFEDQASQIEADIHLVKSQLELANDPKYLERQARDRFDLVGEGDLVFVFSDDEESL